MIVIEDIDEDWPFLYLNIKENTFLLIHEVIGKDRLFLYLRL